MSSPSGIEVEGGRRVGLGWTGRGRVDSEEEEAAETLNGRRWALDRSMEACMAERNTKESVRMGHAKRAQRQGGPEGGAAAWEEEEGLPLALGGRRRSWGVRSRMRGRGWLVKDIAEFPKEEEELSPRPPPLAAAVCSWSTCFVSSGFGWENKVLLARFCSFALSWRCGRMRKHNIAEPVVFEERA